MGTHQERVYDVRSAARQVAERARHVRIDAAAIDGWARRVEPVEIVPAPMPAELVFVGPPADAARWALMVDCLNFCFWTAEGEPWTIEYQGRSWRRYPALVAALRRAVASDARWLAPERWAAASASELEPVFAGRGRIPMFDDRVRILNETGRILLSRFDGEALNLAAEAHWRADRIAALVCDEFPAFRDIHHYSVGPASTLGLSLRVEDSRSDHGASGLVLDVPILKRAQIFASDLAEAMSRNGGPAVGARETLTAFADYRVPQILRHLGILLLEPAFEQRIEAGELVAASSDEEIELRACTIHAVELMKAALRERRNVDLASWLVDEYLWYHSHDADVINQHHKTITWYY